MPWPAGCHPQAARHHDGFQFTSHESSASPAIGSDEDRQMENDVAIQGLTDELECHLDDAAITFDVTGHHAYASDWSATPAVCPPLVLQPSTTAELSLMLEAADRRSLSVVVQGGLTGLSGGATPRHGEVALNTSRMKSIEEIDADAMIMVAQAGVVLETAEQAANAQGLTIPIDIGARGSCTLGGLAATNAGGNRVVRYGPMRDSVVGIEAVLANASVVGGLNRMRKNNAGYDLKHLFIGTEGTLGVISRLAIRLRPMVDKRDCAACACNTFGDVVALLTALQHKVGERLESFEVLWDDYTGFATGRIPGVSPLFAVTPPLIVIIDSVAGSQGGDGDFMAVLEDALARGLITDAVISQSEADRRRIWRWRECTGEILGALQHPVTLDISFPLKAIEPFIAQSRQYLSRDHPEAQVLTFGHIGDGNLHLAVSAPTAEDCKTIERALLQQTADFGGAITGEHGVGVLKREFLSLCRSGDDINLMRSIKQALDPNNTLNPGRIFAAGQRPSPDHSPHEDGTRR